MSKARTTAKVTMTETDTDFLARLQAVPEAISGISGEALLSQVPALKQKAATHKAMTGWLEQLKGVTRAYRRTAAELAGSERMEPTDLLTHLQHLEGIFAAAEAKGVSRVALLGKADALTQKIANTMALVGLLV